MSVLQPEEKKPHVSALSYQKDRDDLQIPSLLWSFRFLTQIFICFFCLVQNPSVICLVPPETHLYSQLVLIAENPSAFLSHFITVAHRRF